MWLTVIQLYNIATPTISAVGRDVTIRPKSQFGLDGASPNVIYYTNQCKLHITFIPHIYIYLAESPFPFLILHLQSFLLFSQRMSASSNPHIFIHSQYHH